MAVKKCDEILDVAEEAAAADPCGPGFHLENGVCVPDTPPQQQRPSTVTAPTSLGKTLKAVEKGVMFDPANSMPSQITDWGNSRISSTRPINIDDSLRAEARKFFVLNNDDTMVYLNSSLTEDPNYWWWTGQAAHLPSSHMTVNDASSPITITFPAGPAELPDTTVAYPDGPWPDVSPAGTQTNFAGDMFKVFRQPFQVSSDLFINNNGADERMQGVWKHDEELCRAWHEFIQDPWVNMTAGENNLIERKSPLVKYFVTYTDHHTSLNIPFSQRELERFVNNLNTPAYVNINPDYNFYERGYEELLSVSQGTAQNDDEWLLPNLYSIISKEDNSIQTLLASYGIGTEYLTSVSDLPPADQATWLADVFHFKNIAFPSSQINLLLRGSDHDDVHPMNINLEFQTEKTGEFLNAAELAGMTDNLSKFVMNETTTYGNMPQSALVPFALSSETFVRTLEMAGGAPSPTYRTKAELDFKDIQLMDLEEWLRLYFDATTSYQLFTTFHDLSIFLGVPTSQAQDECSAFRDVLQAIILSGKINQLVDDHFRTFEEMLQGKEAYNETLIYEIVKKSSIGTIQRIFIPNTAELNILNYIDTQVKYDKEYTYEIIAHQLIVGTQYHYIPSTNSPPVAGPMQGERSIPCTDVSPFTHSYRVEYAPSLRIARMPIYTQNTRILDAPPIWPNVDLVPYKGVSNQFLINLSSNVGDYDLQPIIIHERDAIFVQNFRSARQLSPDEPINFKSDDPVQHFEIYRMDTPPSSYEDFAGHLLTVEVSKNATAISYVDDILPNQKYYYMFRGVDVHNNRSNPTEVYQVEIVEFEDMMFFYTSIYNFEDQLGRNNNVSSSRSLRRYLKINPNFIQSLIDYEQTFAGSTDPDASAYNAGPMKLGQAEQSVWSSTTNPRKFKIRVTSKNSGKKFDLNLTCKVQFNPNIQST